MYSNLREIEMRKSLDKRSRFIIEIDAITYPNAAMLVGLDQFVQQCYNLPEPFEIEGDDDSDRQHRFTVTSTIDPYDVAEAQESLRLCWCDVEQLGRVLNKMAFDGFLDEGIYLVNMSW